MIPRHLRITTLFLVAGNLSACAYSLSPMQRRQVTTRVVHGAYEDVYRATLTVIQDEGYQIERTDLDTGLLRATRVKQATSGGGGAALGIALLAATILLDADQDDVGGREGAPGRPVEDLSFVVVAVDDDRTEVRALLVKNDGNVYDPAFYQDLFGQISVEVERREALARAPGPGKTEG